MAPCKSHDGIAAGDACRADAWSSLRSVEMIVAVGDIYALIARRAEASELMRATQVRVRKERGCISYLFAEVVGEPGHFIVVQEWRDQTSLDAHYRSQAFADYQAEIGDLLVRTSELRLHHVSTTVLPQDSAPMDPRLAD